MSTPESKSKKAIRDYLDTLGTDCRYFMTQNMGMGESGVADIVGVYKGRAFAIEVKADKTKKATPWQVRFLESWRAADGLICVASDIDTVRLMFQTGIQLL
jgi:hypothetical protein